MSERSSAGGRRLDDTELAGRARDGDVPAFEALVERYRELAFRVAWVVVRSSGEAEEAVQEAFIKMWFALPSYRVGAPFRPWLLRIVSNEAKNRARASSRRNALALREGSAAPTEVVVTPEGAALAREEAEVLMRALARLPERDRLIVAFRWLFDLPVAEIAEMLDIPQGTVKSRLSRAMGRLRAEISRTEISA